MGSLPFTTVRLVAPKWPNAPPKGTLGHYVWKRRLELALLQREVATRIGVDKTTIANWENNRTKPALQHYRALVDFLGFVPDKPEEGFPGWLRLQRLLMGLTQRELARRLRVDESSVRGWENGKHQPTRRNRRRVWLFFAAAGGLKSDVFPKEDSQ
jgi:transcriptional regulator with XRE-family HTH domain